MGLLFLMFYRSLLLMAKGMRIEGLSFGVRARRVLVPGGFHVAGFEIWGLFVS